MSDGFKCWKESTSTSPSKRHLGHYKCLLTSHRNKHNKKIANFNASMLQLHNTLINASISIATPLTRWTTSEVNYDREREKQSKNKEVEIYKQIWSRLQYNSQILLVISSHTQRRTKKHLRITSMES